MPDQTSLLGAASCVVDVHGGAWCDGDRTIGEFYDTRVAAAGFPVVAIDFRCGPEFQHPTASEDVAAAVRWARDRFGGKVALIGSSSGGHLSLFTALTLEPVDFVAAFWPPTDPLARYRYAQGIADTEHGARLVKNTEAYFETTEAMAAASIPRLVSAGEALWLPPVWLVHAEHDLNVPLAISGSLVDAYQSTGGEIEMCYVHGEPHAFGHYEGYAAERFTDDLVARLRERLA